MKDSTIQVDPKQIPLVYVGRKGHSPHVVSGRLTAESAEPDTFNLIPAVENICFSFETSTRANCTPEDHASALHCCYLVI